MQHPADPPVEGTFELSVTHHPDWPGHSGHEPGHEPGDASDQASGQASGRLLNQLPGQLPSQLPVDVDAGAEPNEVFDRYAHLIRAALGVPVGLVSLVSSDGQVFPGAEGLPPFWQQARCSGLSHSFCQYVVAHDAPLIVTDARQDPVLADNLAIADIGVVAYAGFPLHDPDGVAVGSLCAIDTQPREWSEHELGLLADLAVTAAGELALRRALAQISSAEEAERATAEHLRAVNESLAIGYLIMDADWRITYVNAEGRRVLGAAGDDLTGQILWELFPATVGTVYETNYRRAVDTGQVVAFDAYYPAPLDTWFEIRATPLSTGLALYFLDISARRDAEAAAARAAAQLSALGQVAMTLADAETIDDLATVMAEQGLSALGADGGSLAVPDPDDAGQLLSYITANFGEDTRADFSHLPLTAQLPVAIAARTGQRVLLADEAACAAMSQHVLAANAATGCQAWASIPLRAGGGHQARGAGPVLGVLTAGWAQPQTFLPAQVDLLETFAAQCAQALQRLQAREAERRAAAAAHEAAHAASVSAQRQGALVTIAQALAAAESQDAVLSVLERLGPSLLGSNGCGLCLREDDGQDDGEDGGAHVATFITDSYDSVRHTVQRVPADFPLPAIRSAATGVAIFHTDRNETAAAFPGSEPVYADAGVQASAAVPLRARGRLLGCLSVGFATARTWTLEEQDLLAAFAALSAQALERIGAHAAEQAALAAAAGISETLQRSMLTAPPEPDHLEIAVRYAASAAHAEVGGDWYDAFISADGVTTLVVGDVTGHDMRAAAVMGQVRNLLRGIGFTLGEPPSRLLAAVDRATAGLGIDAVATAVVAQIEQDAAHRAAGTRLMRWSNAGHLPPLLIEADGATRFLDTRADLLLGWAPDVERHDHEQLLAPGAAVLLYTDGLIERRGAHLQDGLDWLAATAADLTREGSDLEQLCDGLLATVQGHLDDDVALLALRAHPEDAPRPPEAGPSHVPAGLPEAKDASPDL